MSIATSIRGLSHEAAADFLRNRRLPELTVTVGLPGSGNHWVKRKLMQAKSPKKQDSFEDFSWSIPDLGAGGEW